MTGPHFVTVKNVGSRTIALDLRFPRPRVQHGLRSRVTPRRRLPDVHSSVRLEPGDTSPIVALEAVERARNWKQLRAHHRVKVKPVAWRPKFVRVTSRCPASLHIDLRRPRGGVRHLRLVRGQTTGTLRPSMVVPEGYLRTVAHHRCAEVSMAWIGPPLKKGSVGSFGNDSVYTCTDCGQAIIFRYSPPHPIHV